MYIGGERIILYTILSFTQIGAQSLCGDFWRNYWPGGRKSCFQQVDSTLTGLSRIIWRRFFIEHLMMLSIEVASVCSSVFLHSFFYASLISLDVVCYLYALCSGNIWMLWNASPQTYPTRRCSRFGLTK